MKSFVLGFGTTRTSDCITRMVSTLVLTVVAMICVSGAIAILLILAISGIVATTAELGAGAVQRIKKRFLTQW
jgi:hypothetical protein